MVRSSGDVGERGRVEAPYVVRDQLTDSGWLHVQRGRVPGVIPTTRLGVYDEEPIGGLADRAADAVLNVIHDRDADPRPLAVGLLGVLGQIPTVFSFEETARHRARLHELISATIGPIVGLRQAIGYRQEELRADMAERGRVSWHLR